MTSVTPTWTPSPPPILLTPPGLCLLSLLPLLLSSSFSLSFSFPVSSIPYISPFFLSIPYLFFLSLLSCFCNIIFCVFLFACSFYFHIHLHDFTFFICVYSFIPSFCFFLLFMYTCFPFFLLPSPFSFTYFSTPF